MAKISQEERAAEDAAAKELITAGADGIFESFERWALALHARANTTQAWRNVAEDELRTARRHLSNSIADIVMAIRNSER